jgi:hypothetical protein
MAPRHADRPDARSESPSAAHRARRASGLQAHRHLRGRVRLAHRLHVLDLRRCRSRARRQTRRGLVGPQEVVILGGGPNRIGQGIEFDYCCCHACLRADEAGYETIMVNCNPETVSTDYDTSDRLYFEPLTAEDVLEILRGAGKRHAARRHRAVRRPDPAEARRSAGEAGIPILGTSPDMIDLAEDRDRFKAASTSSASSSPRTASPIRSSRPGCRRRARLPLVVRPSYVLGGRAMQIIHDEARCRPLPARHRARAGAGRDQGALPQRQDRPDQHAARQEPAAVRPLSVGCHRGRRRLPVRRQGRVRRRHHGAHRGGRHPFGRFGLLAAAALAEAGDDRELERQTASWRWRSRSAA